MRLWVSSVDYTGDVMIGSQVLRQMSDIYRKLRGTLRYLLGNLHDWDVCSVSIVWNFLADYNVISAVVSAVVVAISHIA